MKVILLGAGGMGRWAAHTAVSFKLITRLTVADHNLAYARQLADHCGSKAQAMALDVTDQRALLRALQAHDVVLNCVGPYYRFGLPTLKAAIEAGCHYLDLCDDWEPTLEILQLSEPARQAAITAIIGLGASPGISNLLAMKLATQFDYVEELYTGWHVESAFEVADSHAAIIHWVHQFTGQIAVYENGRQQSAKPLEGVTLNYPGVGERTFYTLGHPEAVTLPLSLPQLKISKNLMHMSHQTYEGIIQLAKAVNEGQMSVEQAAARIAQDQLDNPTLEDIIPAGSGAVPSLFAWAQGSSKGKREQRAIGLRAFAPGMGGMTGIPLAVGLYLLAEGQLTKRGVLTPEAAFNPDAFLHIFSQYCTYPKPVTPDELVYITSITI
ncbi:saccharopine dehydrogenase NADP-binding domain-containing protein [Rhodocytophaga aerolata]|uniref:Saccharopine dehydrogenase NADP-binding domain-containing protein n=1 Tax=Rhodocytophaga aerolata TaxID=455078 RepID=A0ABT8RK17_9BACT|nr:saccharopine dehydrogenase NADP-binding domain-containing protein [Rhodocytophaga aerolata]MDO1451869.1 saccharopine dehydrogenase NADP-binding domain-containing protein [Rhodocytophaga aerolata]